MFRHPTSYGPSVRVFACLTPRMGHYNMSYRERGGCPRPIPSGRPNRPSARAWRSRLPTRFRGRSSFSHLGQSHEDADNVRVVEKNVEASLLQSRIERKGKAIVQRSNECGMIFLRAWPSASRRTALPLTTSASQPIMCLRRITSKCVSIHLQVSRLQANATRAYLRGVNRSQGANRRRRPVSKLPRRTAAVGPSATNSYRGRRAIRGPCFHKRLLMPL